MAPSPPPPVDVVNDGIATIFDNELNLPFEDASLGVTTDFTFPVLENGKRWSDGASDGASDGSIDRSISHLNSPFAGVPNTAIRVELPSSSAFRLSTQPQLPPITLETLDGATINFR